MYSKNVVHEGVIKDIVDLLTNSKVLERSKFFDNNERYISNIAKETSNLVLTFPVIVDESVSINTAKLIAKSVERKMVSMLQMLFSAIDITHNADAFDFIGKIHRNLTSDDIVSFINKMDAIPLKSKNESVAELDWDAINEAMIRSIKEDNVELNNELPISLNDKFTVDAENHVSISHEANSSPTYMDLQRKNKRLKSRILYNERNKKKAESDFKRELSIRDKDIQKSADRIKKLEDDLSFNKNQNLAERQKKEQELKELRKTFDDYKEKINKEREEEKLKRSTQDLYRSDEYKDQVISSDVRKANEEVPSLMIIKFRSGSDNTSIRSNVIGVKAKIIYVSQDDMIDRIVTKNNDNNGLFNFLRATTGEISMLKDFLFAINRAKMDIISTKSTSSPIWKMLERRYIMSKKNWLMRNYNGSGTAIAILVISAETENILNREHGFSCQPNKLLQVMEAYSVMGFVIVDDVKEKARSLYDDNSVTFEVLPYSSLEKEDQSQYKKIINLITGAKE